tara:strand:+ start:612 stop:749 length:138 start_codon:yes stop_codon:yes gene_type:complete
VEKRKYKEFIDANKKNRKTLILPNRIFLNVSMLKYQEISKNEYFF